MDYRILKMSFASSVHFGDGRLTKSRRTFYADTLFSALCIEARKMGEDELKKLIRLVHDDRLRLSDGLPYIGNSYYIPKPLIQIVKESDQGNSSLKKAAKNLTYIPVDDLEDYVKGNMDIAGEVNKFEANFGVYSLQEKASISYGDETIPYAVSIFRYHEGAGLYVCIGYECEEDYYFISDLFEALSYAGIGGKISAGMGKFEVSIGQIPKSLTDGLQNNVGKEMISLSVSLPRQDELAKSLDLANYQILKRSGFVASESYAMNAQKKRDLFVFSAGSVFCHSFYGDIYDVSNGGSHPVYRYAKPMFMGVR